MSLCGSVPCRCNTRGNSMLFDGLSMGNWSRTTYVPGLGIWNLVKMGSQLP